MAPPTGAIPPPLPPSVEEAYRRKCIQLKQRMLEVEEANDASRIRLVRMQRNIEKMRLERAFLLEQLSKRTSTNVEDSEGSPSPPPTPKEKPLRTKRGHRKPSFLTNLGDGRAGSAFIQQGPVTLSPSSDAFSHTHPEPTSLPNARGTLPPADRVRSNGHAQTPPPTTKVPKNGFDLYCNEMKGVVIANNRKAIAEGTFDVDRALAMGWRDLDEMQREDFHRRVEVVKREGETGMGERQGPFEGEKQLGDEDVEMGDDVEEGGSHSGFDGPAVNQG